jgi:uncharacterized protein (TIGR00369 family)
MALMMDQAALSDFMRREFAQMADDFRIVEVAEYRLTLRLIVQDKHLRPGGTVSGPVMFGLADVAVYLAILAMIGPVALAVTTSANMDFMRKPRAGTDLSCTAEILKLGRVLAVGEARLYSVGLAAPVARAGVTYSIPPKAMG